MFMHNHDRQRDQAHDHTPLRLQAPRRYAAVVPAHILDEHGGLIDELIRFALDTLGVQHLELCVYEAK